MTIITLQINQRTKAGKALLDLVSVLSKDGESVKVVSGKKEEKSPYNPEFVAMVKNAADESGKVVTSETLWQDLGL